MNEFKQSPRRAGIENGASVQSPLVTAAIANYNGRGLLDVLLPSLATQTYGRLEIIVVDDASNDDSCAYLAERWPHVEVITLTEKVGVSAALNICATAGQGELVLMLNNDVELERTCVEELVDALSKRPGTAVAAAKLRDFSNRELLDGTGDVYSWAGFAYRRGQGEVDRGQYDNATNVFGACAATALYRRDAFEQVGLFDERFFALCEDFDWAFRAQLAGWGCVYVPSAVSYHIGSASLGPRLSEFALYHNWRNQIWTVTKNYPRWALLAHLPDLLLGQLAVLLVAARRKSFRPLVRAWRDALLGLRPMLDSRREIQRRAVVGRRELRCIMVSAFVRGRWWVSRSGWRQSAASSSRHGSN